MLFTAFLVFLVFSTFTESIIINRLGTITIIFTLILLISSIDLVGISSGITIFNNWFNITPYNLPLSYLILLLISVLLIYNTSNHRYDLKSPYYILLVIANVIGLLLFPLVNDLLVLYIIVELQSYSLYLLTGLHNRSYNASRASLLYFLMGGIASAIILLASYFIYALTGSTNISDITIFYSYSNAYDYFDILLIALLFKMGMAPLHRWSIAVYNYAPTYITAYISVVAKLSIISWIFANANLFNHHIIIIFFYLSLFIAAYKPLYQINIKTILAYSGLINFGYVLLTIISYDSAFYIYLIQYILTHLILFLGLLGASQYIKTPISIWSPLLYIHQLKLPNLTLAFCLILALFSLIGIPPLPGFYAKLYVLTAALQDNYVIETIAIVICSVFATYYYANIIKVLITSTNEKVVNYINPSLAYMIALCTILLFSFFIFIPALSEGLYLITL
jgi:NADH-ubiquinone oxidoreductase chain 2